jgi:hypothetical protein
LIKQHQGYRESIPVLQEILTWVKFCQKASHTTEKSFMQGRITQYQILTNTIAVLFLKVDTVTQPAATPTLISPQLPTPWQTLHQNKD